MVDEGRIESAIDRLMKLWPIGVLIFGVVAGYLQLRIDVADLKQVQEKWQSSSEIRRERNHEEIDDIKNRLIKVETLVQVIRKAE